MAEFPQKENTTASQMITDQIAELPDWRGEMLARLRALILEAAPGITEEWKWGTAVWTHNGLVCSAAAFKDHVKVNFFQGAALQERNKLFTSGFDAKGTRAVDFKKNDLLDEPAFKDLIRIAVAYNISTSNKK